MKKSVYEIQNPIDFRPYSMEYIIQALANAGQRLGLKGDGVTYSSFTFKDIFDDSELTSLTKDDSSYAGKLQYIDGAAYFKIIDKDTKETVALSSSINISNTVKIDDELDFNIPIDSIECYSPNSIIHNDGQTLTLILVGKYAGKFPEDEDSAEIIYVKYDLKKSLVTHISKAFPVSKDNESSYYCLIKADYDNKEYELTSQVFDADTLDDDYTNEFSKTFKYGLYSIPGQDFLWNPLNEDYIDIENLYTDDISLIYNEDNLGSISIFDVMLWWAGNAKNFTPKKTTVLYDDSESNPLTDLYDSDVFDIDITDIMTSVNTHYDELVYNMFKYYNERYWVTDEKSLYKHMLCALYEKLVDDEKEMYMPLDYEIGLNVNSNDIYHIYGSYILYVSYEDISDDNFDDYMESLSSITINKAVDTHIDCVIISFKYNAKYNEFVDSITIDTPYTLPYINSLNRWVINNVDTNVSAVGKDAGNPNIILLYTYKANDSYKTDVLVSFKDSEKMTFEKKTFFVNSNLFKDDMTNVNNECIAQLPVVTESNASYYINSLVISLSSVECLLSNKDSYCGDYIQSLWRLDSDTHEFEYVYAGTNKYALTLDCVMYDKDNVSYDKLVNSIIFKVNTENVIQSDPNVEASNYMFAYVKDSLKYRDEMNISYRNDINILLESYPNKDKSSAPSKYLDNIVGEYTNRESNFTNALYPRYEETTTYSTTIISTTNSTTLVNKIYGKSYVQGYETVASEVDSSQYTGTSSQTTTTIKIVKHVKKTENWPEYTFNTDVPVLDLSEVMMRNSNTLNRLNIITPAIQNIVNEFGIRHKDVLFNSYIGTSIEEDDKSVLHIGTTEKNINIGTNTLHSPYVDNDEDEVLLTKQDAISIDFPTVILNSDEVISAPIHTKQKAGSITYESFSIKPIGKIMSNGIIYAINNRKITDNKKKYNNDLNNSNVLSFIGYDIEYGYPIQDYVKKNNTVDDASLSLLTSEWGESLYIDARRKYMNASSSIEGSIFRKLNLYEDVIDQEDNVSEMHVLLDVTKFLEQRANIDNLSKYTIYAYNQDAQSTGVIKIVEDDKIYLFLILDNDFLYDIGDGTYMYDKDITIVKNETKITICTQQKDKYHIVNDKRLSELLFGEEL